MEGVLNGIVGLVLFVFRLTFPLVVVTVIPISWLLAMQFRIPQFAGWAILSYVGYQYASANAWYFLAAGAFVLVAILLAYVAFSEHGTQASGVIKAWVIAAIFAGGTFALPMVWAWTATNGELAIYGFLLLVSWDATFNALVSTTKLYTQRRARRPVPAPYGQQPHNPRTKQSRQRGEPETI